jgi:hypothetical protein
VEAFDWNCPKYITPRFTEREVRELRELASGWPPEAATGGSTAAELDEIGSGALKLVVTGIREMTPRVRTYELRAPDWSDLPAVTAGAHLVVPVRLSGGRVVARSYSLAMDPHRRDLYEIAVLREETGRGGSAAIHATWQIGTRLALDPPANQFPLHDDARPAVLIAGGIGITPIKAMAHALKARGTPFELHYSARTPRDMAYRDGLTVAFPGEVHPYFTRSPGGSRIDLPAIMRSAPAETLFYVCGPARLIEAARDAARELAIAAERVQYESFE